MHVTRVTQDNQQWAASAAPRGRVLRGMIMIPAVLLSAIAFSACSKAVDTDELEKQVSSTLEDEGGQAPKDVECSDELEAEEGATTSCVVTDEEDQKWDANVEAIDIDGSDVKFEVTLDDEPK